ncbi:5'-3' exoribonuclease 1 [Anopheles cruzii]|uniref:5'-3' exoribonuclease 1 n=1 Tax=Anopheles cruzii TaxID=68878 RepID=UPI0022EC90CD|nr:5'-3' exoribonuclease 1 [Anopheles cruzii]
MGVPKFFRYISERYPCLSELLRENQVPEFDNLYLDMNGIIHNCSHPNDADVTYRISEEMIFEGIFHYVEYLFKLIRPQKVFFIAVDGVAPRAKMNQQRGRRFRSAFEAQEQLKAAIAKGETIPEEERFDSNCITPGTAFMVRLQRALEHFIQVKIATDVLWKGCNVILSGHETPGEGEHKIMEYIRHAKAQPDFCANTRHCLYGLDADLIMLGLCTHERFFSLLREEVKFGKNDKKTTVLKDIRFYLLHLTLMSEYLELEFASVRDKLSFAFDIHKLIDDWVLLGYLVGNDFIPHLPHLHINENALPTLYRAYMDVLPKMDGYINEGGILNLPRLQLLMRRLAAFDREVFLDRYTDLKYLEGKSGSNNLEAFDVTAEEIIGSSDKDLMALIMSSEMLGSEDEDDDDAPLVTVGDIENDPELFEKEFQSYKRNYYMTKMGYPDFNEDVRAEQAECYIRALQWTLHYYYRGVVSWSWYYPHHYAPFISDVDNFAHLKLVYELAIPFLPFQQLLSVLPAASRSHLPAAYHQLMTDPNSPVYDFYPPEFATDMNGKQQSWEAVVLIPFIDEKRLLAAMDPRDAFLTDEEKQRNVHGPMVAYRYDARQHGPLEAKHGFARIDALPVQRSDIYRDDLRVAENRLVLGPSSGAILDGYAKGFPTFKHLPHYGKLKELHVKIFNFASKNESMVVCLDSAAVQLPDTAELAKQLLDQVVYISWPHLMEAKVVRVSDKSYTYEPDSELTKTAEGTFGMWCKSITEHNDNRLALNVGPIKQLVHVKTCVGTEYVLKDANRFVLKRLWNPIDVAFPAQCVVRRVNDVMKKQKPFLDTVDMFPLQSTIFLRATESYGSMGEVADISGSNGYIKGHFLVHDEPDLRSVFQMHKQSQHSYRTVNDTAAMLGVSIGVLLQLVGTIQVAHGGHRSLNVEDEKTVNIGLRLRMMAKDEAAVGYCRRANRMWLFSDRTISLLQSYDAQFPELFEKLEMAGRTKVHFETDLFGEGNEGKLKQVEEWLKAQEHTNAERRCCGIDLLEPKAIEQLVQVIDGYGAKEKNQKVRTMLVHPKDLLRPGMRKAKTLDPKAVFELLDRVVVVQDTEDVPVGQRGTIIGIHRVSDPNPVRREAIGQQDTCFEVLFDEPFPKGVNVYNLSATEGRVQRLAQGVLLNISYGRASNGNRKKVKVDAIAAAVAATSITTVPLMPAWEQKTIATTESIQQRVSERIGKRNGDSKGTTNPRSAARVTAGRPDGPQQADQCKSGKAEPAASNAGQGPMSEEHQLRKSEFERFWNKLKDASSNSAFDESDIRTIAKVISQPPGAADGNAKSPKPQPDNWSGDSMTGMLKKMLRIPEGSAASAGGDSKPLQLPAPTSLPKPPIQWQKADTSRGASVTGNNTHPRHTPRNASAAAGSGFNGPPPNSVPDVKMLPFPFGNAAPVHQGHQQQRNPFFVRPPAPMQIRPPVFPGFVPQQQQYYGPLPMQKQPFFMSHRPDNVSAFVGRPNYAPPQLPIWQQMPPPPLAPYAAVESGPSTASTIVTAGTLSAPNAPLTNRGPIGPQNLSYNRNNPAGNGAFVPLQAMKKNAKNRTTTTANTNSAAANSASSSAAVATTNPPKPRTTMAESETGRRREGEQLTNGGVAHVAANEQVLGELDSDGQDSEELESDELHSNELSSEEQDDWDNNSTDDADSDELDDPEWFEKGAIEQTSARRRKAVKKTKQKVDKAFITVLVENAQKHTDDCKVDSDEVSKVPLAENQPKPADEQQNVPKGAVTPENVAALQVAVDKKSEATPPRSKKRIAARFGSVPSV